jgi:preprotein translocase subunit SecY
MSEFTRRLAVTLAALAVYRLGAHLPLAGIDIDALTALYGATASPLATERISAFSLGVTPIISVLILIEVVRLLSGRFDRWADATPQNARSLERYAFIGALLLAAAQAVGFAHALESVDRFVTHPGPLFRLGVIATLVASTALIVWLAGLISREGLGNGLWILFLAPHLGSLPSLASSLFDAVRSGSMAASVAVVAVLSVAVAVAVIALLARPIGAAGLSLDRALLWPLFIAGWLGSFVLSMPLLFPDTLANWEEPFDLVALAAIALLISLAQWHRLSSRNGADHPSPENADEVPMALTALAMAGLAVMPGILTSHIGAPAPMDGRMIIAMVVVVLPIQALLQERRG